MNLNPNLKQIILAELQKASSQGFPLAHGTLLDAVIAKRPQTSSDEFSATLEKLCDAGQVCPLRVNRGGIWQNVYQTNQAASTKEKTSMSNPNTGASKLMRAIVMHGPITDADLAIKTGIAAKSIDSLLDAPNTRDAVTSRRGFCAEKGRELKHYMTTTQADDWDAREAESESEKRIDAIGQNGNTGEHYTAHVMSAPEAEETRTTDNAEKVSANRILAEKLQHREQDIEKMRALLASKSETIVQMEDQIEAMKQNAGIGGKLALLLIDSADLTEVEELDANCDPRIAQAAAMARIDHGHAARAVVVRIIGEAVRQVQWKAAA